MDSINLIGSDIKMLRDYYDEALLMQGIKVKYQFPNLATTNSQSESLVDSYSEPIDTYIFFDGNPKVKTFKKLGWVVENSDDLPSLVHCSFNLPHVQRDAIFRIAGLYAEIPDRLFRVTELTYDLVCPDHIICQVVPVYGDNIVGRTPVEVKQTFNTSNHFLKQEVDYRGNYHTTREETEER